MTLLYAFGILICLCHLVWSYTLRTTYLETYKSDLFAARSALYELAEKGGISYKDEVYAAMEERINMMIGSADILSFSRFIVTAFIISPPVESKPVHELYHQQLDAYNSHTKKQLMTIESRLYTSAVVYLIRQNMLSLLLMEVLRLLRKITRSIKDISSLKTQFQATVIEMSYQPR